MWELNVEKFTSKQISKVSVFLLFIMLWIEAHFMAKFDMNITFIIMIINVFVLERATFFIALSSLFIFKNYVKFAQFAFWCNVNTSCTLCRALCSKLSVGIFAKTLAIIYIDIIRPIITRIIHYNQMENFSPIFPLLSLLFFDPNPKWI